MIQPQIFFFVNYFLSLKLSVQVDFYVFFLHTTPFFLGILWHVVCGLTVSVNFTSNIRKWKEWLWVNTDSICLGPCLLFTNYRK